MPGRARFAFTVLAFGYAFLYLPIALVILYSFNESRMVTVWAGFSTKWWSALFANEAMLDAAWLSLRIALVSATLAALLGLAAGYVLARVPRFLGRTLFASLVIAPMVMPEVVMGISMLLLFVGCDQLVGWTATAASSPSPSPTSPSRSPSSPSSCRRGSPISTARSRRRRWISAPRRGRPSSPSPCR